MAHVIFALLWVYENRKQNKA